MSKLSLLDREIDLRTGEVRIAGAPPSEPLTTKELELLRYLAHRAGEDVTRAELLADVWGYAPTARTRAVDFTVRRLRLKIEARPDEPACILTAHGVGYRFAAPELPAPAPAPVIPVSQGVVPPRVCGREAEIAAVREALDGGARLVTVTGPPGIGTSTVAAAALADRVIVRLDASAGLAAAVRGVLGVHDPGASLAPWIRRSGAGVWVLDDAVVTGSDALALVDWLRATPGVAFVVVAHAPLGIRGERVVRVGPLPEAAALEVARSRSPQVSEADLRRAILAAEGYPLALVVGAADVVDARAAVAGALDVAWSQIGEDARNAWEMLASLCAPVSLTEAEALLGSPALDALEELARRGLVTAARDGAETRFWLTTATRGYGLSRAASTAWSARRVAAALGEVSPGPGARAELRRVCERDLAAARKLATLGEVDDPVLAGLREARSEDDLLVRARVRLVRGDPGGAQLDAARAAHLARGKGTEGPTRALAGSLAARAALVEGAAREAATALRQALGGIGPADHERSAEGFLTLALVQREVGKMPEAEEAAREAVHRARLAGRPDLLGRALVVASTVWRHRHRLAAAAEALEEAERLLEGGDRACAARERAILDLELGRPREAREALLGAARDLEARGWRREAAEATLAAAVCAWHAGRADQAVDELADAAHAMALAGDRPGEGIALCWRAAALAALGDVEEAGQSLVEATARLAPLDLPRAKVVLPLAAAHVARARGDVGPAAQLLARLDQVEASERVFGDERELLRLLAALTPPGPRPGADPAAARDP